MARRFSKVSALALVAVVPLLWPVDVLGQGCSEAEEVLIEVGEQVAVELLRQDDLVGYRELLGTPNPALSTSCREALAGRNPARVRCTEEERSAALTGMILARAAAEASSTGKLLEELEAIRDEVSDPCWRALNSPTHPIVREGCDEEERGFIAAISGDALSGLRVLYGVGWAEPLAEVRDQMREGLSSSCLDAVQAASGGADPWAVPGVVGNLHGHGGGTYSMAGVGGCTPSGCVAF